MLISVILWSIAILGKVNPICSQCCQEDQKATIDITAAQVEMCHMPIKLPTDKSEEQNFIFGFFLVSSYFIWHGEFFDCLFLVIHYAHKSS